MHMCTFNIRFCPLCSSILSHKFTDRQDKIFPCSSGQHPIWFQQVKSFTIVFTTHNFIWSYPNPNIQKTTGPIWHTLLNHLIPSHLNIEPAQSKWLTQNILSYPNHIPSQLAKCKKKWEAHTAYPIRILSISHQMSPMIHCSSSLQLALVSFPTLLLYIAVS